MAILVVEGGESPSADRLLRYDVDTTTAELHDSVRQGKEGVVATSAHVAAWPMRRTTLPNDNGTNRHGLPGEAFYAAVLGAAISTVTR